MPVLDYQKTPAAAVRQMAENYSRMGEDSRAQAQALLKLADEYDAKFRQWQRAAKLLEVDGS